jgi:hypothetical protein
MAKPLRLRPVTDGKRSGRTMGLDSSVGVRSVTGNVEEAVTRSAPWLSFNAAALPAALAESSPDFGPNRFLIGANLPWIRYGLDFGASASTPDGGLHADETAQSLLDEALARLRAEGVEHARVFLFCDGRAGIRFGADGTPEGLDAAVFEDVDVLLACAERHRIGLFLVLFDAGLVAPPSVVDGVACGGHGDVLGEPLKRNALLENVLEPLLERYGRHPAIDAWDIFDEPECATLGMACPRPVRSAGARRWGRLANALRAGARALGLTRACVPGPALVLSSAMRSFLGAAVQSVHKHTRALATVGLASTANLGLVEGLGLDFYQAHWWETYGDASLRRAAADFRLDRPLVLGAFPAFTQSKSVKTVLDTARSAGYGGALVWSLRPVDERCVQQMQLSQWVSNHAAQLYRHPPRVEAAAEPVPVRAVEALPPEAVRAEPAPAPSAAADSGEEDEPRARAEPEPGPPGLAAAPA